MGEPSPASYLTQLLQNGVSATEPALFKQLYVLMPESPGVFHTEPVATGTGQLYVLSSFAGQRLGSFRRRMPSSASPPLQLGTDGRSAAGSAGAAAQFHPGLEAPDPLAEPRVAAWALGWAAVGRKAGRREPEGHEVGTEWRRKALRTQVQRRRRPGGLPCPALRGPRPAERWVWAGCGPRWRGRPGGSEPTGPHCSPVTLPLALLPLSNTLLSGFLLSPFQRRCLFISQPAWLFSFLLSEVPERKVLFSAV